ncbi:MAG: archaellar assembly protein FlaJ [Anaerolineae bacterium]|nr:archaellar assembly protein FlaJ [Anaerolineae bacterium]
MNSSVSLPKPAVKSSSKIDKVVFKPISAFDLYYQLTYMSAMAASGISRAKIFSLAGESDALAATYFVAINTLVDEMRYEYPEACRKIGIKAKSENMKSFLLRLSDALRSGEPLAEYLAREAEVQGTEYQNQYERDLEGMKQWTNAFSSILISTVLIVIIQMISSMIYSMQTGMMSGLVATAALMACFGAWIIYRSAPKEVMTVKGSEGSSEQRHALRLLRLLLPLSLLVGAAMALLGMPMGIVLIIVGGIVAPIGYISQSSDKKVVKKDVEFSTFLRSLGGMASSSGTTVKQALTRIDLSSFPAMEPDITRLSTRLQALVDPTICWHKFGLETGSKLISQVVDIFYGGVKIGGDPERVGYLCSLFTAKTSQLRAKRRLASGTFTGLTLVMQAVVSGLMLFVLSIIVNFTEMVKSVMPSNSAELAAQNIQIGMGQFSASDLQFLTIITVLMIIVISIVTAASVIICDGGYKPKFFLFLAFTCFISGICFLVVPGMVAGILTS